MQAPLSEKMEYLLQESVNWPLTANSRFPNLKYYGKVDTVSNWPLGPGKLVDDNGVEMITEEFHGKKSSPFEHMLFTFPNGLQFDAKTFNQLQIYRIHNIHKMGTSPMSIETIKPYLQKTNSYDNAFFNALNSGLSDSDTKFTQEMINDKMGLLKGGRMRRRSRKHRSRKGRSRKRRSRRFIRT